VNIVPNGGIAVPLPLTMTCFSCSSVRSVWNAWSRKLRGVGPPPAVATPPAPSLPWQRANDEAKS